MIAFNAQPIVDARANGYKPNELVIVSLIGRLPNLNHTVHASTEKGYDWSWVRGLEICIYAASGVNWMSTAQSIAAQHPTWLAIWDSNRKEGAEVWYLPDARDIEKPSDQWRWNLSFWQFEKFQNRDFEGGQQCN